MTAMQLDMFGDAIPIALAQRDGDLFLLPPRSQVRHCRSCGAEVVWIFTPTGAQMPISVVTIVTRDDGTRYGRSHFVDCPHAAAHRKDTRIVTLASGDQVRIDAQGREVWLNEESA